MPSPEDILLDTCCLLNLANGGTLDKVLRLPSKFYFIGPVVADEVGDFVEVIAREIEAGYINLLSGQDMTVQEVRAAAERFQLGAGESECILYAMRGPYVIATDDRKARRIVQHMFGRSRLRGSLGLLSAAVGAALLDPKEAKKSYDRMVTLGGFLPEIPANYFL